MRGLVMVDRVWRRPVLNSAADDAYTDNRYSDNNRDSDHQLLDGWHDYLPFVTTTAGKLRARSLLKCALRHKMWDFSKRLELSTDRPCVLGKNRASCDRRHIEVKNTFVSCPNIPVKLAADEHRERRQQGD